MARQNKASTPVNQFEASPVRLQPDSTARQPAIGEARVQLGILEATSQQTVARLARLLERGGARPETALTRAKPSPTNPRLTPMNFLSTGRAPMVKKAPHIGAHLALWQGMLKARLCRDEVRGRTSRSLWVSACQRKGVTEVFSYEFRSFGVVALVLRIWDGGFPGLILAIRGANYFLFFESLQKEWSSIDRFFNMKSYNPSPFLPSSLDVGKCCEV
ncbi:hypothetical protein DQ04_08501000 [Trypanosoma grayi]|uniref:hypothetical protein n=1 Tax=Trypanosoma grayi TaxID=71804 RepID=UPI0004F44244|nr:hypothetical protein DQ04_08501000 [Trypanosoma grayi]KEG07906.1 hypothetical protein DQ04_08501000 [Trypanosoma grayi]